ncbi:MAG: type II toxin-antitoxin system VapC family toxin [Sphingobacteriaceae bacterium]|nr:MAG: type II toxin-antitoxin system VapC family toxin [Sphingobacteriaceae bacterium]
MVRYLLDTQILIWLQSASVKLPKSTLDLILTEPKVYMSKASIWEIAIKVKTGKLNLNLPLNDFIVGFIKDYNCEILDITLEHIYHTLLLPLHHRDPFDRLIIAQAAIEQISIISSDQIFDEYGVNRIF